ncbi:MAG: hypothetical protein D8M52_06190 [Chlorobi bacterium]|nr:hypothetical protein [Chlorobiota bacterium]MBV6463891.1 hypothetical protein [Chlorobiota bacterium]
MKIIVLVLCMTVAMQLHAQVNEPLTLHSLPSGSDIIVSNSVVTFKDLKLEPAISYDVMLWNGSEGYWTHLVRLQPSVQQFIWSVGSLQGKYYRLSIVESQSRRTVMSSPAYFSIVSRASKRQDSVQMFLDHKLNLSFANILNTRISRLNIRGISLYDVRGKLICNTNSTEKMLQLVNSGKYRGLACMYITFINDAVLCEEYHTVIL